ncbi:MAG: hypothetical protein WA989_03250, partial [Henriciella sp.]
MTIFWQHEPASVRKLVVPAGVSGMGMVNVRSIWAAKDGWFSSVGRERQILEYLQLTSQLMLQRHASFLAATILT